MWLLPTSEWVIGASGNIMLTPQLMLPTVNFAMPLQRPSNTILWSVYRFIIIFPQILKDLTELYMLQIVYIHNVNLEPIKCENFGLTKTNEKLIKKWTTYNF